MTNKSNQGESKHEDRLIEGIDFVFDERGLMVLTAEYHLKRGYCCKNICRNCPYGYPQKLMEMKKNKSI